MLGSKPPPRTTIIHYSHKLTIAAPLLVQAATLLYTAHVEELQTSLVLQFPSGSTPTAQERAVNEFHYETRLQMVQKNASIQFRRCFDSNCVAGANRECPSVQMDEDWYRIISCHSLRMGAYPLRGIVFQPGTLAGSWKGRLLVGIFLFIVERFGQPHLMPRAATGLASSYGSTPGPNLSHSRANSAQTAILGSPRIPLLPS